MSKPVTKPESDGMRMSHVRDIVDAHYAGRLEASEAIRQTLRALGLVVVDEPLPTDPVDRAMALEEQAYLRVRS